MAPLLRRLDGLEARMGKLSDAIARIDAALADGTAFLKGAAKSGSLAERHSNAADASGRAEEEWPAWSAGTEAAARSAAWRA